MACTGSRARQPFRDSSAMPSLLAFSDRGFHARVHMRSVIHNRVLGILPRLRHRLALGIPVCVAQSLCDSCRPGRSVTCSARHVAVLSSVAA